jgi:hypothetical protein
MYRMGNLKIYLSTGHMAKKNAQPLTFSFNVFLYTGQIYNKHH